MDVLDFVYLYTRTQSIQKQMVEYDIKSKYLGEYSTFDKVGRGAKAKSSKVSELTRYVFQNIWSNSWNSTVK